MSIENETTESPLEVEQKYRVPSHDKVLEILLELQATELPSEQHCDTYLQHPSRDFGVSGEAFRVREVNDHAVVTYKGARLAGPIKTRVEIEIPLAAQTQNEWMRIWQALGFREVSKIRKLRRSFSLLFQSNQLTIALDNVQSLGMFVEVEAIVQDRTMLTSIQNQIVEVAELLKLDEVEPRSYLRQLLEQNVATGGPPVA